MSSRIVPLKDATRAATSFGLALSLALILLAGSGCIGGNLTAVVGEDGNLETSYGKVTICHKGETLEVTRSQLTNHMQHGDKRGKCR